jgi:hypothetical protein
MREMMTRTTRDQVGNSTERTNFKALQHSVASEPEEDKTTDHTSPNKKAKGEEQNTSVVCSKYTTVP